MKLKDHLTKLVLTPLVWRYISMPGKQWKGQMPRLLRSQERIAQNARRHVTALAVGIGDRSMQCPEGLEKGAQYVENGFRDAGCEPGFQEFVVAGMKMRNIFAEVRGRKYPNKVFVFGAHYDTVPGTGGADDNASGVAALLELARILRFANLDCTVRFVAFANEENSGHTWQDMGSYHYARACRERNEDIIGMISLEMLGFFSNEEGSQKYPRPFNLFYPTKGNFIAFVGNYGSRDFVRRAIRSFRKHARVPSEGVAAPERFRDIGRSDHWSFWQFGYDAFMLTDTSNFRFVQYHTHDDTPDKVDFYMLALIVDGLTCVVRDISNEERTQ